MWHSHMTLDNLIFFKIKKKIKN